MLSGKHGHNNNDSKDIINGVVNIITWKQKLIAVSSLFENGRLYLSPFLNILQSEAMRSF